MSPIGGRNLLGWDQLLHHCRANGTFTSQLTVTLVVVSYNKSIYSNKFVNAVTPAIVFYKTSLAMHGLGLCFVLLLLMLFKTEPHYETLTGLESDI